MKKVAVVMGSDSDYPIMKQAVSQLKYFGIPCEVRIISAHRTPEEARRFASSALEEGFGVIIAAAGKAAHLGGFLAAYTVLPVIGVPIRSSALDGLDSLLSMVQMPQGIPVATVAVDGAGNSAVLAAEILALSDPELRDRLWEYRASMAQEVRLKDSNMQSEVQNI